MPSVAPGGGDQAASTRLTSSVWTTGRFTYNFSAEGGTPSATCRDCTETLCAGGRYGTSHLRRHIRSKRCEKRAAELQRQLLTATTSAEPPPPGGQQEYSMSLPDSVEEEEFFVVNSINIPELFDDLVNERLVNIEESKEADEQFGDKNHVATAPQEASSSTST